MRRGILSGLVLLAAAAPFSAREASAQDASVAEQRIDLSAQALPACVLSNPAASDASNASFAATGANSGQISIARLVDANTAMSLSSSVRVELPLICNSSHRVVLRSTNGGLRRSGAGVNNRGSGGFADFLPYRIVLGWAGQERDRGSDQGEAQIDADRPASGVVVIRVTSPPGQGPLVAGQYSDSIIVEFQPAN